jgi:hypothetical protein
VRKQKLSEQAAWQIVRRPAVPRRLLRDFPSSCHNLPISQQEFAHEMIKYTNAKSDGDRAAALRQADYWAGMTFRTVQDLAHKKNGQYKAAIAPAASVVHILDMVKSRPGRQISERLRRQLMAAHFDATSVAFARCVVASRR